MKTAFALLNSTTRQQPTAARGRSSRRLAAAALMLLAATAQAGVWTSTGSAGAMDEATMATDLLPGKLSLSGPYATLLANPSSGNAVLRYNVTSVFGVSYAFTPRLMVRFADSGTTTRVLATLKSYDTTTGNAQTLASVDSNVFAPSSAYQTQWSCMTSNLPINEFNSKVYWVEVELSRTAATGTASVAALRIDECVW